MAWFLVDDNLTENPKFVKLLSLPNGLQALGLWTLCGSWSRKYRTHGAVSAAVADMQARKCPGAVDASALVSALIEADLWEKTADGFQYINWEDIYDVEDKDAKRKEKDRKRKQRTRAGKSVDNQQDESTDGPRTEARTPGSSPSPSPTPDPALASLARIARADGPDESVDESVDADEFALEPTGSEADVLRPQQLVRVAFERRYHEATTHKPTWTKKTIAATRVIGDWLDEGTESAREFELKLKRLMDNFFADEWARGAGYPVTDLADRCARYFEPPKPTRDVRKGFVPPPPASAFNNPTNLDNVFGPEKPAAGGMRR